MLRLTDTDHAPWWIVPSDDKKSARINCIGHILSAIPYKPVPFEKPQLGKRQKRPDDAPAIPRRQVVPDFFPATVA